MTYYRYLTASRAGKWYPSLTEAQRHANRIGAGFTDANGDFVSYRGAILEMCDRLPQREWARRSDQ